MGVEGQQVAAGGGAMRRAVLHRSPSLQVIDFRCGARPGDASFDELHERFSVSVVRRGSFGYEVGRRRHELVPGATLIGHRGRVFRCTHDHHLAGDECLSFQLSDELAEAMAASRPGRQPATLPPTPRLAVLGALALQTAAGQTDLGLEEVALAYVAGVAALAAGEPQRQLRVGARDRKRAVEAALLLDERSTEPLGLEEVSGAAGLSPYHFLRLFRAVLGVTPHQYLLRTRLRRAAGKLAAGAAVTEVAYQVGFGDLSNFVRTFRRAAGVPPGAFRLATRRERRILQERLRPAR